MIDYSCPHCGKELRIPPEYAGQRGKCNSCNNEIEVPRLGPDNTPEIRESDTTQALPKGVPSLGGQPLVAGTRLELNGSRLAVFWAGMLLSVVTGCYALSVGYVKLQYFVDGDDMPGILSPFIEVFSILGGLSLIGGAITTFAFFRRVSKHGFSEADVKRLKRYAKEPPSSVV